MHEFEQSRLVVGSGGFGKPATTARFLSTMADGNLPAEAFQRWLLRDYHFAMQCELEFFSAPLEDAP